jgi:hypothetical protein
MQWRRRLAVANESQTESEAGRVAETGGHPLSFLNYFMEVRSDISHRQSRLCARRLSMTEMVKAQFLQMERFAGGQRQFAAQHVGPQQA